VLIIQAAYTKLLSRVGGDPRAFGTSSCARGWISPENATAVGKRYQTGEIVQLIASLDKVQGYCMFARVPVLRSVRKDRALQKLAGSALTALTVNLVCDRDAHARKPGVS